MRRVGLIMASSNVVVETAAARIGALDISWHAARMRVARNGPMADENERLYRPLLDAAVDELGDAEVDASILALEWGGALGLPHDRELADAIGQRTGRPATTTLLALLDRLTTAALERIALLTPFTPELHERARRMLADHGVDVVADVALGLDRDRAIAEITPETLMTRARPLLRQHSDAIVLLGTNLRGYEIDRELADLAERPVLDSVRVILDAGLSLAPTAGPAGGATGWAA